MGACCSGGALDEPASASCQAPVGTERRRVGLASLPDHIIEQIVDEAGLDRRGPHSLVLTCRAVSEAAQRALLADVQLGTSRSAASLLDVLERRPERRPLVRTLDWTSYRLRGAEPAVELGQVARIIELTRNLRGLSAGVEAGASEEHDAVESLRSALVGLDIRDLSLSPAITRQGALASPAPPGAWMLIDLLSDPLSTTVRSLCVRGGEGADTPAVIARMSIFGALTNVTDMGFAPPLLRAVIERSPALSSLNLLNGWHALEYLDAAQQRQMRYLNVLGFKGIGASRWPRLAAHISQLVGLHTLSLTGTPLSAALFAKLPPSIVVLSLTCVPLPGEGARMAPLGPVLVDSLERGRLPALRRLTTVTTVQSEALDRLCDGRGIALRYDPADLVRATALLSLLTPCSLMRSRRDRGRAIVKSDACPPLSCMLDHTSARPRSQDSTLGCRRAGYAARGLLLGLRDVDGHVARVIVDRCLGAARTPREQGRVARQVLGAAVDVHGDPIGGDA